MQISALSRISPPFRPISSHRHRPPVHHHHEPRHFAVLLAQGFYRHPSSNVSSIIWPTKQPCQTSTLTGDAYVKVCLPKISHHLLAGETINYRFLKLLVTLLLLARGVAENGGVEMTMAGNGA